MTLHDVVDALNLNVLTDGVDLDRPVKNGYTCDLLSAVLASAQEGDLWITIQRHRNIIAVAKVASLSGIILAGGIRLTDEVIRKAEEEGVPLLSTKDQSFTASGRLYRFLSPEEG